eukprot:2351677-Amphidinium_carterae.2
MRPLKAALQASGFPGSGFDVNGGFVANRLGLPTWIWSAITEVAERPGRARLALRPRHFQGRVYTNAAKKSAAMGTLFRKPRRNQSA